MSKKRASGLTKREEEVVKLLAIGRLQNEIAQELCLSSHTVKGHIETAKLKINARNKVQLVMWAYAQNIVHL